MILSFLVIGAVSQGARAQEAADYASVGEPLEITGAGDTGEAAELFGNLQPGDTVSTVFRARVLEVCQARGCWMRLELEEGRSVMVRFKDYGFFVPMDIAGREVAVGGKAFISEVSEEERRHLARDAGRSETEVKALEGPVREAGFEASGVRIFN